MFKFTRLWKVTSKFVCDYESWLVDPHSWHFWRLWHWRGVVRSEWAGSRVECFFHLPVESYLKIISAKREGMVRVSMGSRWEKSWDVQRGNCHWCNDVYKPPLFMVQGKTFQDGGDTERKRWRYGKCRRRKRRVKGKPVRDDELGLTENPLQRTVQCETVR